MDTTNMSRQWTRLAQVSFAAGLALASLLIVLGLGATTAEAACQTPAQCARQARLQAILASGGLEEHEFNPDTNVTVYQFIADLALHTDCSDNCQNRVDALMQDLKLHHDCNSDRDDCRKQTFQLITSLANSADCGSNCKQKIDQLVVGVVLRSLCDESRNSDRDKSQYCESEDSNSSQASGAKSAGSASIAPDGSLVPVVPSSGALPPIRSSDSSLLSAITTGGSSCPRVLDLIVDGKWQVNELEGSGAFARPLTDLNSNNIYPVVSPDCAHVAFLSDRNSGWNLFIMNMDGTNQTAVTSSQGGTAFQAHLPLFPTSMAINVPTLLSSHGTGQPTIFDMGWAVDSHTIVYQFNQNGATQTVNVSLDSASLP